MALTKINSKSNRDGSSSLSQVEYKPDLTLDQRQRIENNRKRALEIQKKLAANKRDASKIDSRYETISEKTRTERNVDKKSYRPTVQRKEYIEFDFSQMKDTKGGFIGEETTDQGQDNQRLEEWKKDREKEHVIKEIAPPIDLGNAPKCFECGSLELDPILFNNFNQVRSCRACKKRMPEKYSLLTKTECKEDYFLTEPELKDKALLPRIDKPNPHGYSRMQLYLRFQVEEFAWKKWGSSEGLDAEWERRETLKLKRREKKYQDGIREMRKKTRAEEYTRKLRDRQSSGERHTHDWSAPLALPGKPKFAMRRCVDCGVESEEMII